LSRLASPGRSARDRLGSATWLQVCMTQRFLSESMS
jgi:hypothetical protein